jgi:hypothetical protein
VKSNMTRAAAFAQQPAAPSSDQAGSSSGSCLGTGRGRSTDAPPQQAATTPAIHSGNKQQGQQGGAASDTVAAAAAAQPDPRLLVGLPAPALQLVLQLASSSGSPTVCRLCCVSKGLREVAEAAAVQVSVLPSLFTIGPIPETDCHTGRPSAEPQWDAVRYCRFRAWLQRRAQCVQGLYVPTECSWWGWGCVLLGDLVSSNHTQSAPPAAAGSIVSAEGAAAAAVAGGGEARGVQHAAPAVPLVYLHLGQLRLVASLVNSLALCTQLQVLVLEGCWADGPDGETVTQLQLHVIPHLRQLRRLALAALLARDEWAVDALLRSLPASLRALDLTIHSDVLIFSSSCSRSSLSHMRHLTSLRLIRVAIEELPSPGQEQDDQVLIAPASPAEAQQQQQQHAMPQIKALSIYVGCYNRWLACPSLEALELDVTKFMCSSNRVISLAPLAACRHLQQLCLRYDAPCVTGVSVLTQLKRLRLETPNRRSSFTPRGKLQTMGAGLAALGQLRVLEVPFEHLEALQPRSWLPQLHSLTQLGALRVDRSNLQPLQHLTAAMSGGSGGSSSSRSRSSPTDHIGGCSTAAPAATSVPAGGGSSSASDHASSCSAATPVATPTTSSSSSSNGGGDPTCAAPRTGGMKRLVLTLQPLIRHIHWPLSSRYVTHLPGPSLEQAVSSITAAHPGWQVDIRDEDTHTCPCWTGEAEAQRHSMQP